MSRTTADHDDTQATGPLVQLRGLDVDFAVGRGRVASALRRIDLDIAQNSIVGLVGESGSGKSTLAQALMGLLPSNAVFRNGEIRLRGRTVEPEALRGRSLSMVFQDPMNALHPVMRIGTQMIDAQRARFPKLRSGVLRQRAADMLRQVGIADPENRLEAYPHQLSGGMRQRVMIAMALLVEPDLLIADEPTTALDATIEAQIAELLRLSKQQFNGSILFVSHSLALVSELCDHVVVLYAGTIVERADVRSLFSHPAHPYTRALIACEPRHDDPPGLPMVSVPGDLPDPAALPPGCVFAPRCAHASERCHRENPVLAPLGAPSPGHLTACWHPQ